MLQSKPRAQISLKWRHFKLGFLYYFDNFSVMEARFCQHNHPWDCTPACLGPKSGWRPTCLSCLAIAAGVFKIATEQLRGGSPTAHKAEV